jgi:PST family polysaccharide transporter
MTSGIRAVLRHRVTHNVVSLYGIQIGGYIVPLVTVPYLARVLGVAGWGAVAFAQAYATYLTLLIEFGFNLSATREVARHQESAEHLADLLSGVLGAKLVLAVVGIAPVVAVARFIPIFTNSRHLLLGAVLCGVAAASSMSWLYQGLEQMRVVAAFDLSARICGMLAIFCLVHSVSDAPRVLYINATASGVVGAVLLIRAYGRVRFHLPTAAGTWQVLRAGWTMFILRCSMTLYTSGNAFVLGLFASPEAVGYYAGAERISKALIGLLQPLSQALYPRMANLVYRERAKAVKFARIGLIAMGGSGLVMCFALLATAPQLIRCFLGTGFQPAVAVLRILSLLPPCIALSNVLGVQWMLPLGMDHSVNRIIIASGLLNLSLALILAPRYGSTGMAWAVVTAELVVTASMYVTLRRRHLDPIFGVLATEQ